MHRFYIFIVAGVITLCSGCSNSDDQGQERSTPDENGTQEMAKLLATAYADIDPAKSAYLVNQKRLEFFKDQTQSPDLATRIRAISLYCYELLNTGASDRAVVELEALNNSILQYKPTVETMLKLRKLLATAYLRIGEQQNCVGNRSHESCILPISGGGIYTMTKGSEKAIELALGILNDFPDDAETMWLLNVAHMTLGTYPHDVPEQWRVPESTFAVQYEIPRFTDVSQKVGISGTGLAGGCAVDDFNNDGLLDIIASSWGLRDGLKYYVNNGRGGFDDHSEGMQLDGITSGLNLIHADYDNDGDLDFFMLRGAWLFDEGTIPNSLIRNNGDGSFTDVTIQAGVLTYAPSQTAVWADFNLDGLLDLFVGTETSSKAQYPCEFYLNNGDGTFKNIIDQIGVDLGGFVKGCAIGDVNNDGWPDLYISYYNGYNKLLVNGGAPNGIPKFQDVATAARVEAPFRSFPTWFWDFDNDGWDDIFVSGYGSTGLTPARDFVLNTMGQQLGGHPRLYINMGDLTFQDVSLEYGLTENIYTMGCNYGDLDGDGYLDMYLGTGDPEYTSIVPNKMFRNDRGHGLQDVTTAGGFGHVQKGHGVGFGDFDNDGDEDIFEVLGGAFDGDVFENILFENPGTPENSWVTLRLHGTTSNRSAIGAKVKVVVRSEQGEETFYRTVSSGGSFGGSSLQIELGLGPALEILELVIKWPYKSNPSQSFENLAINRCYNITEGASSIETVPLKVLTLGAG